MCETYQEQVQRLVHALGRSQYQAIVDDLQSGSTADRLRLFVDGNCEKRFEKLSDQLEFVAEAFDDFEHLIEVFIRQHPLAAYDTAVSDAERMLLWLLDKRPLSPEQRDYVLCQRARHAVVELARCNRSGHVAFQQKLIAQRRAGMRVDLATAVLHLNPIRSNATFVTRCLLDSLSEPPTEVLFFPDGHEIASVVLEPTALKALLVLVGIEPCTLAAWAERLKVESEELRETAERLLEVGLLAMEVN